MSIHFKFRPLRRIFLLSLGLLFTISCSSFIHKTGLMWERSKADLSKKEVQIGDFKWVYLEGGESDETLLAIHGFGGDKDHWTRFSKYLTEDYRVISPDLPGFGENSRIQGESYSIKSQVQRLHAFATKIGLKKYHILGNSMGGSIAGVYAATYPDEVTSLTLFDNAGVDGPEPSELYKLVKEGKPNPLLVGSVEDFDRLMKFSFVNPPYIPGALKTYFTERAIENRNWNEGIFTQIRAEGFPLEPLLPKIKAPTLVIWGREDRVIDKSCTIPMDKKLKSPHKIYILPDVGHAPMIEVPKDSAQIWKDWKINLDIPISK
ncbi:alpha/beta hydrolase [Leptospira ognonensis]|uniref:Alpha/beta hydrolase n=2 Tax=Leptospira ognonensis TaxID=2484945 RepID=A0A4R9KF83_9LEPT|nr:alpha/beta hydrolase [Leptospira ognonensis]